MERTTETRASTLTFLIADVRGYTAFTRERGDAAAAVLAGRFANLARDAVEARSGRVIELRGDEALAVFDSPGQAVRAAVEFQATCAEESLAEPSFQLPVGIGVDMGEAVPVEDGYRGVALNMAARLCSNAAAGQVLVSRTIEAAVAAEPGIGFVERGPASFKGFDRPVDVIEVRAADADAHAVRDAAPELDDALPPELDPLTPLVQRDHEMRWLRGTWRCVRRGDGRVLFVSGPAQIGKTRLAAELAAHVRTNGGRVRYAGPGGAGTALALSALRDALTTDGPTLLVLDDLDVAGTPVATALTQHLADIERRPLLVLGLLRDPALVRELHAVVERVDRRGDGHRAPAVLDLDGVREVVRLYVGEAVAEAPVETMSRSSAGVPGRVHEVASEWARSEAARRLEAAAEYLAAGRRRRASELEFANNVIGLKLGQLYTVGGRDVLPASGTDTCPYKGLAQFDERDSGAFFGRERLVGELAARTVQSGLLGVVGPSGSGKSSVVAAGLLPSLAAGLLPGSDRWHAVALRPGEHPEVTLRAALSSAGVVGSANDPPDAIAPHFERIVLVVDQFEEMFTVCRSDDERAAFVGALTRMASDPDSAVVLVAMRSDYYGECASYPELAQLLSANHVLVGPMTPDELRRAIEFPARRAGLRVEQALVDALVEEVRDEPGGLPLLSTALVELWQLRDGGWLRMDAYERTGGVRGAVARLAESSFAQLDDEEQAAARRVFLRLAGVREGDAITRRRIDLRELDLERDTAAAVVVDRLARDRLLTIGDGTVEVAHEALLREWPRLVGWLGDDIRGRELHGHLTEAARRWDDTGREPSELYRGARLSAALDWAAAHGGDLNDIERDFLADSRLATEREADRQRRTNRRLRGLLAGVAVFLVLALVAGALALVQRSDARRQALVATSQRVGAQALLQAQLDRSLLLAREAVRLDDSVETRSDLLGALLTAPQAFRIYHGNGNRILVVALSPDDRTLALADNNGTVDFVDTASGRRLGSLRLPDDGTPISAAFSPDGRTFLASPATDDGGLAVLYDAATYREIDRLPTPSSRYGGGPNVQFLADGRIGVATVDNEVFVWDPSTGRTTPKLGVDNGDLAYAAFSPDGTVVAASTPRPDEMALWDVRSRRRIASFRNVGTYPFAFSPDGSLVAAGASDGSVSIIDVATGDVRRVEGRHTAEVQSIGFSPDGRTLVTTGDDRLVIVWEVATGIARETLRGHAGRVLTQAISSDSRSLYTGSLDATAIGWDLGGAGRLGRPFTVPSMNEYFSGALSPDGSIAAVTERNTDLRFVDADTLEPLGPPLPRGGTHAPLNNIAFSPDGTRLVATEAAGLATGPPGAPVDDVVANGLEVWDVRDRRLVDRIMFPTSFGALGPVRWAPDGRRVVVGSVTGFVGVVDVSTGRIVKSWRQALPVQDLAVTDRYVAAALSTFEGSDAPPSLTLWTLEGRRIEVIDTEPGAVAAAPDGRTIATGGGAGVIELWDVATGKHIGRPMQAVAGYVTSLAYDPSGRTIAAGGTDGTVTLWDASTQHQIGSALPGQDNVWVGVVWSGDGDTLLAFYQNGHNVLWDADPADWSRRACQLAGRNLTRDEWARFVPEREPSAVCPQYPKVADAAPVS